MSTNGAHKRWMAAVVAFLVLGLAALVGVAGCGGSEGASATTIRGGYSSAPVTAAATVSSRHETEDQFNDEGTNALTESVGGTGDGGSAALPSLTVASDQMIIIDGTINIEVEAGKFQTVFDQARLLADRYGGYIVSANSSATSEGVEDTSVKSGTVAIRIPFASFNKAVSDAKALGEVKGEQIQSQDVSEEYVDLQARIRNSEANVEAIFLLMDKATTLDQILQVRSTLTNAQQELEQLKGRLSYLEGHTSYSTLTMSIYEPGTKVVEPPKDEWGFVAALKSALHKFVDATNAIVRGLGTLIPVLIVVAIVAYIVYLIARAIIRRNRAEEQARYQPRPQGRSWQQGESGQPAQGGAVIRPEPTSPAGAPAEAGPDDQVEKS
jgi:hypothetical protein